MRQMQLYSITTYLTHSFVYKVHPSCTIKNILFILIYWNMRGYSLFNTAHPTLGIYLLHTFILSTYPLSPHMIIFADCLINCGIDNLYVFCSQCNLSTSHSGWTILVVPADTSCQVLRVELKDSSNNIRVRQLQVLAKSGTSLEPCIPAMVAQLRSCEVEVRRIFRLLTLQVSHFH